MGRGKVTGSHETDRVTLQEIEERTSMNEHKDLAMSTPNKTPVDLSKAKIGQEVRLKNGALAWFVGRANDRSTPYYFLIELQMQRGDRFFYNCNGKFKLDSRFDVVEILPIPKKKAPQLAAARAKARLRARGEVSAMHKGILQSITFHRSEIKRLEALV